MKIQNSKFKIQISLLFAICYLLFTIGANAQSFRTFTISPPAVDLSIDPGEKTEGVMKVINDSDETLTFTATIQDFIVEDTIGTPILVGLDELSKKYSAASWIGIYPSTFSVAPHQRQNLNYYIQIPPDAGAGGHYAAVVFKPSEAIEVEGTGAAVNTLLGTLFYVGVNGDINENASVTKFLSKTFQEYGPVELFSQVQNNGDLHIKPKGNIALYDLFGRKVETSKLTENNIFPSASRDYKNVVGEKFMIGRYRADLLASFGVNNNLPLTKSLYFIVFPWKIALLLTLLIITAVLAVIFLKRKKRRKDSLNTSSRPASEDPPQAS